MEHNMAKLKEMIGQIITRALNIRGYNTFKANV